MDFCAPFLYAIYPESHHTCTPLIIHKHEVNDNEKLNLLMMESQAASF